MSNGLGPDQDQPPNCLQRLSADDKDGCDRLHMEETDFLLFLDNHKCFKINISRQTFNRHQG